MINYVPLNQDLLPEVHVLYNQCLELDPLPLEWLREKTLGDPDFNPATSLVALWEGTPVGFVMSVIRSGSEAPVAGIKVFFVKPEFRNQGIASAMLTTVEENARRQGAKTMTVGFTRPDYVTPGVDPSYTRAAAFLLRRGYNRRGEVFNMDVPLAGSDWSTSQMEAHLARQGVTCKRLEATDVERLLAFFKREATPAAWQYQVRMAYEHTPPGVFVAVQNDSVIAFSCYDGVRPGWFGPMAAAQKARGSGLGSLVFLKALQAMQEQGYQICHINCVGPLYFYSKVAGAKVSRVFWQFDKALDAAA
ncbi:MAG: GNAT family N-acetyltransferase [Armatimonadetes bacterium]|nr:GNAT family N-acetyltransferase [Armatimonadota bacterium]